MTLTRAIGMTLLALTGVGAIYMLLRTYWVSPKCAGIVLNYNTQKYERLEPGIHCLLNPFLSYVTEVSTQTQIKRLAPFTVKSLDNVDATIQADITYEIENPLGLYERVADPDNTFTEQVKSAFSSAIQTLNFPHVTSAEINRLAKRVGHTETEELEDRIISSISNSSSATSISRSGTSEPSGQRDSKSTDHAVGGKPVGNDGIEDLQLVRDGSSFFKHLLDKCKEWGIKIINFRIITIEAKHLKVSQALELTAEADVRAKAQLKAAASEAQTMIMLAEAAKKAQELRTAAAIETGKALSEGGAVAQAVYAQDTHVRAAQALGSGRISVLIDASSQSRLSTRGFAAFSTSETSVPSHMSNSTSAHPSTQVMTPTS